MENEKDRPLAKILENKGTLAAAIVLSCVSILAIPFIYLLIVRLKRKERQSTLKEFGKKGERR